MTVSTVSHSFDLNLHLLSSTIYTKLDAITLVSVTSQEVVQRDTLKVYDVKAPTSILELGLRHEEQISLLEKVQNSVLAAQSKLIDTGYDHCPKSSQKLHNRGQASLRDRGQELCPLSQG